MGAWGTGYFENDGAGDFLADYRRGGVSVVEDALMSETDGPDAYMEVDEGQSLVAAAEVVANCNDQPTAALDDATRADILAHKAQVVENSDLVGYARAAVPSVMNPESSELYQLWEEAAPADFSAFKMAVANLIARLEKIA